MTDLISTTTKSMEFNTLDQLWQTASLYGRVYLHTYDNGGFACVINFNTKNNIELKARGTSDNDVKQAMIGAIENAILIKKDFKD